jgi:hypothetical protein
LALRGLLLTTDKQRHQQDDDGQYDQKGDDRFKDISENVILVTHTELLTTRLPVHIRLARCSLKDGNLPLSRTQVNA